MTSSQSPRDATGIDVMLAEVVRRLEKEAEQHLPGQLLAQEQAARHEATRADELRRAVQHQLQLASLRPGLPAAQQSVDGATQFARQVWRRRNTV